MVLARRVFKVCRVRQGRLAPLVIQVPQVLRATQVQIHLFRVRQALRVLQVPRVRQVRQALRALTGATADTSGFVTVPQLAGATPSPTLAAGLTSLFVSGFANAPSGKNVEIGYSTVATTGIVSAFDRTANAALPIRVAGSTVKLDSTVGPVNISSNGLQRMSVGSGNRTIVNGESEAFGLGVNYNSTGGVVYFGATSAVSTPDAQISGAGGSSLVIFRNNLSVAFGNGIGFTNAGSATIPGNVTAANANITGAVNVNTTGGVVAGALPGTVASAGVSQTTSGHVASQYSTDATGTYLSFEKSRGATVGALGAVANADLLGQIIFSGVNTTPAWAVSARIRSVVDGAPGATFIPTRLEFLTGTNAAGPAIALTISADKSATWANGITFGAFGAINTSSSIAAGNTITSSGANAGFTFADRIGTAPTTWTWYATSGIARLSNVTAGDAYTYSAGGWATAKLGNATSAEVSLGALSGTVNINYLTSGARIAMTLTAATSIGVAANPPGPCQVTIKVVQSAPASTLTWSAAYKWAGGVPPAAGGSSSTSIYAFYYDGAGVYWGSALLNCT